MIAAEPVLVMGASGSIGACLLERLRRHGIPVLAVSRHPPQCSVDGVTWLQHDLDDAPLVCDASVIFSAGPVRHVLGQLEVSRRIGRIVMVSRDGTHAGQARPVSGARATNRVVNEIENELVEQCRHRHVALTILRPTLAYGGHRPDAVDRLAELAGRMPVFPVAGRGLRQPVHVDDLAGAMLAALRTDAAGDFELGGGETLDYPAMIRRIAAREGRIVRFVRLPATLLCATLGVCHLGGRLRDIRPDMLRRQALDLVVDDTPARQELGWMPRPFRLTYNPRPSNSQSGRP